MTSWLKSCTVLSIAVVVSTVQFYGCGNAPVDPTNSDASVDILAKGSCRSGSAGSRKSYGSRTGGTSRTGGRQCSRTWKGSTGSAGKSWCDRYRSGSGGGGTNNGGNCSKNPFNPPQYDGCVQSVEYWQDNPDVWPPPFKADLQFCTVTGASYYAVFTKDPTGNWYLILAQEYIAALLNKTYNKGDIPPEIQAAIDEAQLFYHDRDPRVALTAEEIAQAQALADVLSDFNTGNFGLDQCVESCY